MKWSSLYRLDVVYLYIVQLYGMVYIQNICLYSFNYTILPNNYLKDIENYPLLYIFYQYLYSLPSLLEWGGDALPDHVDPVLLHVLADFDGHLNK